MSPSPIPEVLEDLRQGRMVILVDDPSRENEGDLTMLAEHVTPEAINFMITEARGLICIPMAGPVCDRLQLLPQVERNTSRMGTAFTVSIEAAQGVTTGISAADRAHTIRVAASPDAKPEDLARPGHIFPLRAKDGGVLVRGGQTEGIVDLARLAGAKTEAGIVCEIMNPDGTMARMPQLEEFAEKHGLKIATIADLIAHRRRTESIVLRAVETGLDSRFGGDWRMIVYTNKITYAEHVVLVKGDITTPDPVLVRMHALSVLDDVLGNRSSQRGGGELQAAMQAIGEAGRGVVVLIREPTATALSDQIKAKLRAQAEGRAPEHELRDYGVGAQILLDLGIQQMVLLTNTKRTIIGLEGYGLTVVDHRPLPRLD